METSADQLSEEQKELSRILREVDLDLMGTTFLGSDGVFRSFTGSREVIGAVPFSPGLIKALLDRMPFEQETEDRFRGVDGRHVPRDQWYRPADSDVPATLTKEEEEEGKRLIEEKGAEWWQQKQEERKSRDSAICPVMVISNYNLKAKQEENQKK